MEQFVQLIVINYEMAKELALRLKILELQHYAINATT